MGKFYGTVTVENIEEILDMIFEKLNGQVYTFTAVNQGFGFADSVEVRTNQKLGKDSPPAIYWGEEKEYAGFNFGDTYGVWGISTSKRHGDDTYGTFENPYVVIEWSNIKITHRAPMGHLLHWQITLQ